LVTTALTGWSVPRENFVDTRKHAFTTHRQAVKLAQTRPAEPGFFSAASRKITTEEVQGRRRGVERMLLKLSLALALGSIGLFTIGKLSNGNDDRTQLEATIDAQLKALREHLFKR